VVVVQAAVEVLVQVVGAAVVLRNKNTEEVPILENGT